MKTALYVVIGLVALVVAATVVVAILQGVGVIDIPDEGEGGKSDKSTRGSRDEAGSGRDENGGGSDDNSAGSRCPQVQVTRVIDGDTVETDKLGRVRLIGVDTPEERRCYSTAATAFTRERLGGRVVGYELGVERKDRYGRTLAYLYRDENMHDLDLVRKGYGRVLTIRPNDKYAATFRRAARGARTRNAGVWGICEQGARRATARRVARKARARRRAREARVRRAREARERHAARARNRPTPPSPPSPGGGGEDNFNIPGIPGD